MKNLIVVLFLMSSGSIFSQSDASFFAALKNSDIVTLESYLEDNIDFCLFEDQQIMSKSAALNKLKGFLSNHKISAVEVIHKGSSKDKSSRYKVAKITTSKDTFRVFVYASGEIGAKTVKEIRIDKF
jgi:acylphosphatase